jgi:hypothetical protein
MTKSNAIQGLCLFVFLTAAIFMMIAAADLWMPLAPGARHCVAQFPKWIGCALASHENLGGGLIGAAGTIYAGWIAWKAAERTINIERRKEDEAYEVITADLLRIVRIYALVWRAVEYGGGKSRDRQARAVNTIGMLSPALTDFEKIIGGVTELSRSISALRQRRLSDLLIVLRYLIRRTTEDCTDPQTWITGLKPVLSHFEYRCREFNPALSKSLESFHKVPLDQRDDADHLESIVTDLESGGNGF